MSDYVEPIAIVGIGGVFPGAPDLDAYWEMIRDGRDAVCEVPAERWIMSHEDALSSKTTPDKTYSKRACLIHDFTPELDGLSLGDLPVDDLDPLHLMTLHAGAQAIRDVEMSAVDRQRVGVILAAIALPTEGSSTWGRTLYQQLMSEALGAPVSQDDLSTKAMAAKVTSFPASLLAKALGVGGGSYTLDAACASSLYSVKLACDELRAGRADMMVTGGVSRPDNLYTQIGFSQLQALSPSGVCSPFDAKGDGLVVGEGAGVVILKRLKDALAHGDEIHGLIHGVGLSNDIGGNLLAPDSEGQLRAMKKAYALTGWEPQEVDLIECHGTGTPLGDKKEVASLQALWQEAGAQSEECVIGSVKSMIGHLLTAASVAGLIKVLLSMKHKTLPPTAHFSSPPESIPLEGSPFSVLSASRPWKRRQEDCPRKAAVSAFGFGGINAHMLIEEWDASHTSKSYVEFPSSSHSPLAIVGIGVQNGHARDLDSFRTTMWRGDSLLDWRPSKRWRGFESSDLVDGMPSMGAYFEPYDMTVGEFRIPPHEIPQIMSQQLVMLQVAAEALRDAGMPLRERRPEMGTCIGINFDFETTDFHLRWALHDLGPSLYEVSHSELPYDEWFVTVQDALSRPLNATSTVGSLGGIVGSRVAKEFLLGGPSFVVSAEEASGLRALEVAARALQQGEVDAALVGAVDLTGDIRQLLQRHVEGAYTSSSKCLPFDVRADGTLPGDAAVALVLKRYDDALADQDHIYSVFRGVGFASGSDQASFVPNVQACEAAIHRAHKDASVERFDIGLIEANGSGIIEEDLHEAYTLTKMYADEEHPIAVSTSKKATGHTGAAAGLLSVVHASLCLSGTLLPASHNAPDCLLNEPFHTPKWPQHWLRDQVDGSRHAAVHCLTSDGNAAHVLLEQPLQPSAQPPEGQTKWGLFPVAFSDAQEAATQTQRLKDFLLQATEPLEQVSRRWCEAFSPSKEDLIYCVVTSDRDHLLGTLKEVASLCEAGGMDGLSDISGVYFAPRPHAKVGQVAFVYPGSGNHYFGMGRELGLRWPQILREMDAETERLRTQLVTDKTTPWRADWPSSWRKEAKEELLSDPHNTIFSQVVHGGFVTRVMRGFGLEPDAMIGYSLGESAGLFALEVWQDRCEMLNRILASPIFRKDLGLEYRAAREVWGIPEGDDFDWKVYVIPMPAEAVREAIPEDSLIRLLIVNTPDECVVGGRGPEVEAFVKGLGCNVFPLEGVITVHCEALSPVEDAYKALHTFEVHPDNTVRYYRCFDGQSYDVTTESAADAVTAQALHGFDFTKVIKQAYEEGVRFFFEMGPQASCSRMIHKILEGKDIVAQSACVRFEDDVESVLRMLAQCLTHKVPVSLDMWVGQLDRVSESASTPKQAPRVGLHVGGEDIYAAMSSLRGEAPKEVILPVQHVQPPTYSTPAPAVDTQKVPMKEKSPQLPPQHSGQPVSSQPVALMPQAPVVTPQTSAPVAPIHAGYMGMMEGVLATGAAHGAYLDMAARAQSEMAAGFMLQNHILQQMAYASQGHVQPMFPAPVAYASLPQEEAFQPSIRYDGPVAYDFDECMEFAVGKLGNVFGPAFAEVDTYPVRVRLPDYPLMLVDRIISIEGEMGSLGPGRIVTEHVVKPDAWYLDHGRMPVCVTVEAGQADLFLSSYLGIDLAVKGKRSYRLLDATIHFHRSLPRAGEIIYYDIRINKFVKQGDVYLFFFEFDGTINGEPLLTMRDGCAGFFTHEEVDNSGGIILKGEDLVSTPGKITGDYAPLLPIQEERYDELQVEALRRGDLATCFGPMFSGLPLQSPVRLPTGFLELFHRVLALEPEGGRFGLGRVQAQADIHPDDWFLTCHFVDDMVMPGTLMYECCAHTLRVLLMRMGWVDEHEAVRYEPVPGVHAELSCRGPVLVDTKQVMYEVEIKEIGYRPEPYVIADALMYGDGRCIVSFKNMSIQLTGSSRERLESLWSHLYNEAPVWTTSMPAFPVEDAPPQMTHHPLSPTGKPVLYDKASILAYAEGNPSEAFGEPYKIFDEGRVLARLPRDPYLFMDRVVELEPPPWELKAGGWIECEYDVPPDAWYFRANRQSTMSFAVLLEIALQPCGWLAAYVGSALHSDQDLSFRNLGGEAILHAPVTPDAGTLTMRVRMKEVSKAGGMIIEKFDMLVYQHGQCVYEGDTYFGFFSDSALAEQVGIIDADSRHYLPTEEEKASCTSVVLEDAAPLTPYDPSTDAAPSLCMPAKALRMVDEIELFLPEGGPDKLGFLRGVKHTNPDEWFFHAHFYQDPVWPGSLGLESFLQIMRWYAIQRWPEKQYTHEFEPIATGEPHKWIYRGQILPKPSRVEVDVVIKEVKDGERPYVKADGFLKVNGLYIYEMVDFGLRLVPHSAV